MSPLVRVGAATTGVRCGLKFTRGGRTNLPTSCADQQSTLNACSTKAVYPSSDSHAGVSPLEYTPACRSFDVALKVPGTAAPWLPAMPNLEANGDRGRARMQELEDSLGEDLHLIVKSPRHSKFESTSCHCSAEHHLIQISDTSIDCRILACTCPVVSSSCR